MKKLSGQCLNLRRPKRTLANRDTFLSLISRQDIINTAYSNPVLNRLQYRKKPAPGSGAERFFCCPKNAMALKMENYLLDS